jgi:membrane-bound lytic murein transglycosylase F
MVRGRRYWAALLIGLLLAGCSDDPIEKQPDELLVGVLDDPVFFEPARAELEQTGFELDLLRAFAETQKKKLRIVTASDPSQLQALLKHAAIDFVAGMPKQDNALLRFTTPLREARPLIVQQADALPISEPAALASRVVEVLPGTMQETALRELPVEPPVVVENPKATNGIDILQRVSEYRSDLVATDSIHFDLAVNFFPDLIVAQELPGKVEFSWAFRATDETLYTLAEAFVVDALKSGLIARTHDRHFGHLKRITSIAATQFIEDMRRLLPHYRPIFERAQVETGFDWRLLAALAYQESKWDPDATSYTGVRGMMMLTEETADRLNVKNRLDPAESIDAGARYLAELKGRLSDKVSEPDRLWMTLAAYNLGMGHLNGARQIAPSLKRDPNSWYDMKKVLPLMAQPEYYERLKSGRARGGEAVILVENVRTFYDILVRFEAPQRAPLHTNLAMQ